MRDKLYKFLREDGSPTHAPNTFKWPLPTKNRPGKWVSVEGELIPCENGLHLVRFSGLLEWADHTLYEAEGGKEFVEKDKKVLVFRRARLVRKIDAWNEKDLRLFARDCAERALRYTAGAAWYASVERVWRGKRLLEYLEGKEG